MQIFSLFGPNFYINDENISQPNNNQQSAITNSLRNEVNTLISRLFRNSQDENIQTSPQRNNSRTNAANTTTTTTTGTQAFNDLVFYFEDDMFDGLTLGDMNEYTTLMQLSNTGENENLCSICQLNIEENTICRKLNNCAHYFHVSCIDRWLQEHNSCPTCRVEIRPSTTQQTTTHTQRIQIPLTQTRFFPRTPSSNNNNNSS